LSADWSLVTFLSNSWLVSSAMHIWCQSARKCLHTHERCQQVGDQSQYIFVTKTAGRLGHALHNLHGNLSSHKMLQGVHAALHHDCCAIICQQLADSVYRLNSWEQVSPSASWLSASRSWTNHIFNVLRCFMPAVCQYSAGIGEPTCQVVWCLQVLDEIVFTVLQCLMQAV
jgi:hypothetical protein